MKPLLILDINGVLCCKTKQTKQNCIKLKSMKVILRPGYKEFLSDCYHNYRVAFFSSTKQHNAEDILVHLLTEEQILNTEFVWYRDHTHRDPNDKTGIKTVKKLSDVFDNPVVNERKQWHMGNTLMIDDDHRKMIHNDCKNVLICPEFKGDESDDRLTLLSFAIRDKFTQLSLLK